MRCWSVVVPLRLDGAKSRLTRLPGGRPLAAVDRDLLSAAMAGDTLAAAVACRPVTAVVVVADRRAARLLGPATFGSVTLVADPGGGHDDAVLTGAAAARSAARDAALAVLPADLPALTPKDLADALALAESWPRAVVPDASGDGTVLLTATAGVELAPSYGPGSAGRHAGTGAVRLAGSPRLRRDVDTAEDLARAVELGLGPYTAEALRRLAAPAGGPVERSARAR